MARKKQASWIQRLLGFQTKPTSYLRHILSGSLYRVSEIRGKTSVADIHTQIDVMRALARDSQISTALSYYATDATTTNTAGDIIWATPVDAKYKEAADVVNKLFKRWDINSCARDHILELATIGNLYIPTTDLYKEHASSVGTNKAALGINTIADYDFDIVPNYKIPPEDIVHLYYRGAPYGYITTPDDKETKYVVYPESSVIHFSLGGLLGDYKISLYDPNGELQEFDIKFAQPLMEKAVTPTQTLSLLEDALVLSSLIRTVKFINVECGNAEETEIQNILQQVKDSIEQQMSLNTSTGDIQSFVNPQSPNNLIYLAKVKGQDAITITDLNMAETTDTDSKLLQYYQDKKLSVLGVPKEAMNFSSNEGLGGAGSVLSQRSALYANALQRIETAYMSGWRDAINKYFVARGMSGFVDKYVLHMTDIITEQSSITFDRRDSSIQQASSIVDLMKSLSVEDSEHYKKVLTEILTDALPITGSDVNNWEIDVHDSEDENGF